MTPFTLGDLAQSQEQSLARLLEDAPLRREAREQRVRPPRRQLRAVVRRLVARPAAPAPAPVIALAIGGAETGSPERPVCCAGRGDSHCA